MKRSNFGNALSRGIDIVGASAGCLLMAVPGLVIALAIRIESRGPIFFTQERIGKDGIPFNMFKFRSMLVLEDSYNADGEPLGNYERVTKVGGILRRSSLDEVPQLLNVLRGEMSIVGPRPTLRYQVERYTGRQFRRLAVRPGLTGLAQVGGRNSLTWEQKIELDLKYVDTRTAIGDIRLMLRTFQVLITGESTNFVAHDALSEHNADYRAHI